MPITSNLNWNIERWRTRDRLFDNYYPPSPCSTGFNIIHPLENISLFILESSILKLAKQHGFNGSIDDFWNRFNSSEIHYGTLNTFPVPGKDNDLYLDTETNILYYFKATKETIYTDLAARVDIAIVGISIIEDTEEKITYLYIPIKALPIEDLIYDTGTDEQ